MTNASGGRAQAAAHARLGLGAAAIILVALIASLSIVGSVSQSVPVFEAGAPQHARASLPLLSVADVLAVKASHARRAERYDVGLFGNSRAVEVTHADVGLPERRFFNFAVGGTSFRQSVALLEQLSGIGKAPRVAIISIDNHDIGFVGPIYWPMMLALPHRPFDLGLNVLAGRDWWRNLQAQLRGYFTFARQGNRARFLWYLWIGRGQADGAGYNSDGSQPFPVKTETLTMNLDRDGLAGGYPAQVAQDMRRLERIQAGGTRILIYESPIHPTLLRAVARDRRNSAAAFRSSFAAWCRERGISCRPAPVLEGRGLWSDCCHAPPVLLGRFVATLLP